MQTSFNHISHAQNNSICVIAGEASGDAQGALLVRALKEQGAATEFWGIAGPGLRNEGVESIYNVEDVAVMGFSEIIPKYRIISKIYKNIFNEIRTRRPRAVIFIDYPGFNLRLLQDVYKEGITTIYHIPPKAWSHGAKRAHVLRKYCYLVTSILPFEMEFFNQKTVNIKFVGNPLKDKIDDFMLKTPTSKIPFSIGILPGSRENEIKKLLPLLIEAFLEVKKAYHQLTAYIPIAPTLSNAFIESVTQEIKSKFKLTDVWFDDNIKLTPGNSHEVMNKCEYAWVCSGTATLETAFFSTPMAVMYKTSPLTAYIAKKILKIKYVSLVNLCADKEIVPEFLQENATAQNLIDHAILLIKNPDIKANMVSELQEIKKLFPANAAQNAAQEIIHCIAQYEGTASDKFHLHRKNMGAK